MKKRSHARGHWGGLKKRTQWRGGWRGVFGCRPFAALGHPYDGKGDPGDNSGLARGAGFSFQPLWPPGPSLRMKIGAAQDTLRTRRRSCEYEVFKQLSAKLLEHLAAKRNFRVPRNLFTRQIAGGQCFERLAARRDWHGPRMWFEGNDWCGASFAGAALMVHLQTGTRKRACG